MLIIMCKEVQLLQEIFLDGNHALFSDLLP